MSDRIDHAAMAESRLSLAVNDNREEFVPVAQVHATLALVEQQRIANLIALATQGVDEGYGALLERPSKALRPDIAAALGLDQ